MWRESCGCVLTLLSTLTAVGREMICSVKALTFGLALLWLGSAGGAIAANGPLPSTAGGTALVALAQASPNESLSLEEATPTLEKATDAIYQGLEKTQQKIGKTEGRSAAIEHGRDRATGRLQGLLKRAEAADSLDELPNTDQLTLKRLSGSQASE